MDPGNPNVLYASLNHLHRPPWDDISGGPDSGLYKSVDAGDTWTDITRNPGLPKGVIGKIGLAFSPPRPSRIWALVEAEDGALFRSDDAGATWQRLSESRILRRWPSSYMHIVADTQDPDTVYIPTYSFQRSTDGGKTFVGPANAARRLSRVVDRSEKLEAHDRGRRRRRHRHAQWRCVVVDAVQPTDGGALRSGDRRPGAVSRLLGAERQHSCVDAEPHERRRHRMVGQRGACRRRRRTNGGQAGRQRHLRRGSRGYRSHRSPNRTVRQHQCLARRRVHIRHQGREVPVLLHATPAALTSRSQHCCMPAGTACTARPTKDTRGTPSAAI